VVPTSLYGLGMSDPTVLELSVPVQGTIDEVWRAVATGPGNTSWYVPTTIEEHAGGATTSRFGEGPEMVVHGRVTVWDPPRRVCFDGGEEAAAAGGMTFDWMVEDGPGDLHTVRLLNGGFPDTPEGQAQKAAMEGGWGLFLQNLQLHLEHFRGEDGTSMLPMAGGPGPRADVWRRVTAALGLPAAPSVGDHLRVTGDGAPPLAGRVVGVDSWRITLLLDEPTRGTAFIAAEGDDEFVMTSVWVYLYGDDAAAIVARDADGWSAWLGANAAG
jgi:Activator of Hsp90 ATPase homolog 1-like protein